jgi:putative spermidine/putrescine transport system permease protein
MLDDVFAWARHSAPLPTLQRATGRITMQSERVSPHPAGEMLIDSAAEPASVPGRAGSFTGEAPAWLQVAPFASVFLVFFLVPLALTVMVSFWDYTEYEIVPAFTLRSYVETFEGCLDRLPDLCVTLKTYLSTLKFCLIVWLVTLVIGFFVAYFLSFHVRSTTMQIALFLVCTIPFWTSNIIRTISWIPLLGRNGLFNSTLVKLGLIREPIEWLIFSDFSVIMSLVHLYTLFMIVPIFNSMMRIDRALLEAAYDAGASGWQALWNVVIPLSKPGIVIGSIFVITIVMGDFVTVGVMGGQQIASVGKVINTEMTALQFPPAAANSVILLVAVLFIIWALTRLVDIRKEL